MDTSFSFLPTNPLLPSVSDSTGTAVGADPPALGGEFSTLLTGQMLKAERQLFAAQSLSGTGLQVLPLGSKIKLITSDDPLPDMASLAAFARTQGIDEAAVQALFAGQNISVGAPVLPQPIIVSGQKMPTSPAQNRPSELLALTAALNPINPLGQMPVIAATTTEETVAANTASPVIANTNMASWMPLRASALSDISEVTNSNAVSAEVAIQDAMRLTITAPAQAITKRLTQMSGSTEQSTWASLMAGNTLPHTPLAVAKTWETLQLDIPEDMLIGLLEGSQESPVDATTANSPSLGMGQATASTSPSSSPPTAIAPAPVSAQVEQRFIHQQQLADKLGQALAQRLVEQMERGQWKIEMRLRPESLGQIDVELKMHAGGLDALFSAENSVTRELIAQGSGKLKDALTQSGMAVASVWVSGDQSRQSGGNSTPRDGFKSTSGAGREPDSVEDVAAKLKDEPAATNGLNLWA